MCEAFVSIDRGVLTKPTPYYNCTYYNFEMVHIEMVVVVVVGGENGAHAKKTG